MTTNNNAAAARTFWSTFSAQVGGEHRQNPQLHRTKEDAKAAVEAATEAELSWDERSDGSCFSWDDDLEIQSFVSPVSL